MSDILNEVLSTLNHQELLAAAQELAHFKSKGFLPTGILRDKYLPKMNQLKKQESWKDNYTMTKDEDGVSYEDGKVLYDSSEHDNLIENMQMLITRISDIILSDYINIKNYMLKNN